MGNEASIMMLRQQAVETLQKSTKMLEQAMRLLKEGNKKEAEKLRTVARVKRNDSIWLMSKANRFEQSHSMPEKRTFRQIRP